MRSRILLATAAGLTVIVWLFCKPTVATSQDSQNSSNFSVSEIRSGDPVPRDVRQIYASGLDYLVRVQGKDGGWDSRHRGAGLAGMAAMALLASGEDPNFGRYAKSVQSAVRYILNQQDPETGYFGTSMYHHGFATLAIAECYGLMDDRTLWSNGAQASANEPTLTLGQSLELAVRCIITSQAKNPANAWRYSPDGSDADTSVSGAVLMGLLAARNAGIEVPDRSIDQAIGYFTSMTSKNGLVAYAGAGGSNESLARISIASLVYSIARRKDLPQSQATLNYLKRNATGGYEGIGGAEYQGYYQAQALFQGDLQAWKDWNENWVADLRSRQQDDGSIPGEQDIAVSTSLSLLGLAVNFRFLPIYER